jgi:hypothetical protein
MAWFDLQQDRLSYKTQLVQREQNMPKIIYELATNYVQLYMF